MKPRIFISSTFYDLKYIREELASFVCLHGYEPVLFENGDIGYTPGFPLDNACYEAMKNSNMALLIIGGEYGSAAGGQTQERFAEYMSITRNEFRAAVSKGIPVFAMIDSEVFSEYSLYKANYHAIESEGLRIAFARTKNINVFRFIKEIENMGSIPILKFTAVSDIKRFMEKQWADMVKKHLELVQQQKENAVRKQPQVPEGYVWEDVSDKRAMTHAETDIERPPVEENWLKDQFKNIIRHSDGFYHTIEELSDKEEIDVEDIEDFFDKAADIASDILKFF